MPELQAYVATAPWPGWAVLALTVLSAREKVDEPSICMAAPDGALLPDNVLWDTVTEPVSSSPPPTHPRLSERVLRDTVLVPDTPPVNSSIPPP